MNVLLIDDDLDCLHALQVLVEALDHSCTVADDPRDALEQYGLQDFDLVITDFRMPVMTGSELALKIKLINPEAKIVLITGYFPYGESPTDSQFSAVLEKPVDIQGLKNILDRL